VEPQHGPSALFRLPTQYGHPTGQRGGFQHRSAKSRPQGNSAVGIENPPRPARGELQRLFARSAAPSKNVRRLHRIRAARGFNFRRRDPSNLLPPRRARYGPLTSGSQVSCDGAEFEGTARIFPPPAPKLDVYVKPSESEKEPRKPSSPSALFFRKRANLRPMPQAGPITPAQNLSSTTLHAAEVFNEPSFVQCRMGTFCPAWIPRRSPLFAAIKDFRRLTCHDWAGLT